ncbi:ribosome-inactivating family protein [Streptomyces sp. NPDC001351]|uniref:ribosome-inactivating family protein n=1 Tax=Streptomyces sp. NPDC001351 TaxID=3364564 RepID=UPI0036C1B992
MPSIQAAVSDVAGGNWRDSARGLLVLVQAFAEGARYDFISSRIQQAMRTNDIWTSGAWDTVSGNGGAGQDFQVTGRELENRWEAISNCLQEATNHGVPVNFQIGNGRFATLQALDAQVAMTLTWQ